MLAIDPLDLSKGDWPPVFVQNAPALFDYESFNTVLKGEFCALAGDINVDIWNSVFTMDVRGLPCVELSPPLIEEPLLFALLLRHGAIALEDLNSVEELAHRFKSITVIDYGFALELSVQPDKTSPNPRDGPVIVRKVYLLVDGQFPCLFFGS